MKKSEISSQSSLPVKVLKDDGLQYEIVLPDADKDHIQRMIFETGKPYELDMLRNMRSRIAEGDLVLDIGANVGNHALYLAAIAKARVIAFEPNEHLSSAFQDSINRNGLEDKVAIQTIGLGRTESAAQFEKSIPENLGAQALHLGSGDIEVRSIDSFEFDAVVRAIKIDVEGMELAVIHGGRECIARDRPLIYAECRYEADFRQILSWAETHNYTYWETFNATPTHLFLPAATINVEQRIDHLNAHNAIREYRLIDDLQRSRRIEEKAKTEIERVEAELAGERSAAASRVAALQRNLTQQRDALNRVTSKSKKELNAARAYARKLEKRLTRVLESKTWRIMQPARTVWRLVRGRKRQPPFTPQLGVGSDITETEQKNKQAIPGGSNVDDLARKLWGGFSEYALDGLIRIVGSRNAGSADQVKAAWNIARWTAASADWKTCSLYLGKIANLDKTFFRTAPTRVLMVEANLRTGNFDKAIEYAEYGLTRALDGNSICGISNVLLRKEPTSAAGHKRLALLNRLYESAGLLPLALIDQAQGFVFGNLTTKAEDIACDIGPVVSVLVPVYNAEDFIEAAIYSLLAQSWINLEVIAVDDASTDDSWARLKRIAKRDSRLRVFRNETNLGAYPTRNHALTKATGELITVHDSDDWSHPQMIEVQAKALLRSSDIKVTFSMMTRVLPNMEFTPRPTRPNLEYIHRSYPSLMIRRGDLAMLDRWDGVVANADDELVRRASQLWGKGALQEVLQHTPLSFFLRHDQSITEQKGTHLRSLTFGIRQEYANQAEFWRKEVTTKQSTAGLSMLRTDIKTPFPIPAGLAPKNWERDPVYDLVIISDLSLMGGTRRCNEGYITAATELGLRVGLFHWPRYDHQLTEVAPEYRRLSYQSNVDILVPEDTIECDTLLIHHPPILKYRIDDVPSITAERLGILVNQLPMQRLSAEPHYYFANEVRDLCQDLFNKDPVWIPISPLTRRILGEVGDFEFLDAEDWIPPLGRTLNSNEIPLRADVGTKRQIVVGRHSRDHVTKWPDTAEKIGRRVLCRNGNCCAAYGWGSHA